MVTLCPGFSGEVSISLFPSVSAHREILFPRVISSAGLLLTPGNGKWPTMNRDLGLNVGPCVRIFYLDQCIVEHAQRVSYFFISPLILPKGLIKKNFPVAVRFKAE